MFFVITGTSRGLGAALALELRARGHQVVGCSSAEVDVSRWEAVERWSREVLAAHGAPDFLVNNAAITTAPKPLWQQKPEEVRRLLGVNVLGTFHVIRAFLPAMIEKGRGVVVNYSSDWGRTTDPMVAPYCASKWAIEGLTKSLAQELPPGLAVVSLDPGTIDTDMLRFAFGEGAREYPDSKLWRGPAADLLLALGPEDNGLEKTVP